MDACELWVCLRWRSPVCAKRMYIYASAIVLHSVPVCRVCCMCSRLRLVDCWTQCHRDARHQAHIECPTYYMAFLFYLISQISSISGFNGFRDSATRLRSARSLTGCTVHTYTCTTDRSPAERFELHTNVYVVVALACDDDGVWVIWFRVFRFWQFKP